ncbi:PPC domain-containing protein [Chamaesiphon sp. OTE_75_metabat_556]|uniref:PPC domain-containing protein n=1 Tax=Chamaesiphon sp. OTE_75_metabat_556 TaxID=2964692 RepID=UPI00286B260F|nr:PPC domain-containing protein [Chamaesiphon sp. OTE_75_metabat_556]
MSILNHNCGRYLVFLSAFAILQNLSISSTNAAPRTKIENNPTSRVSKFVYTPVKLLPNVEVKETLSDRDIPTGDGGFARDYSIQLMAGDRIAIELNSESFDTTVILLNAEGKTIGKNDDGPDGTSNSLLFTKIKDAGTYVIRIQGFGETSSGEFKLKVSKLQVQQ